MLKNGAETLLEGEFDVELGYQKHNRKTEINNYRNGKTTKSANNTLQYNCIS